MTIVRLLRICEKLVAKGHGRKHVQVEKRTFTHPLETDGCSILPIYNAAFEYVETIDDDGGMKVLADGRTAGGMVLVLKGEGNGGW